MFTNFLFPIINHSLFHRSLLPKSIPFLRNINNTMARIIKYMKDPVFFPDIGELVVYRKDSYYNKKDRLIDN